MMKGASSSLDHQEGFVWDNEAWKNESVETIRFWVDFYRKQVEEFAEADEKNGLPWTDLRKKEILAQIDKFEQELLP